MKITRWIGGALILVGVYGLGTQHHEGMVQVKPAAHTSDEIRISDDPNVVAGVCRKYNAGESNEFYSCVPLQSPDGGVAIRAEEDSSAGYTDGNGNGKAWYFDAEEDRFRQSPWFNG